MIYNSSETPVGISDTTNVDRLLGIGTNGTAKVVNISGDNKVVVSGDISTDHTSDTDEDDKVYSCKATVSLAEAKVGARIQDDQTQDAQTATKTYSCKAIRALVAGGGSSVSLVGYVSGAGSHSGDEDKAYHCKGTHGAINDTISNTIETNSASSGSSNSKVYSCAATVSLAESKAGAIIQSDQTQDVSSTTKTYSCSATRALVGGASSWEADGNDAIKPKNGKNIYAPEISGNLALTLQTSDADNGSTGPVLRVFGHHTSDYLASPYIKIGESDADCASITFTTYGGDSKGLQVNKRITATSFFESSDISLKDNATTVSESALSAAASVPLVEFDWKESGLHSYGTIAQECEKYMPELVSTGPDGLKSVDYIALLCAKVAALEKEMAELKSKVQ